jgi:hypothetical protein
MPQINRYACDKCDFQLPTGWGGYTYATDSSGTRIVCPHPGEPYEICRITGMSLGEAMAANRTGFNAHVVCLSCLTQFDLDLKRDVRLCPNCSSNAVKSVQECVGQLCPNCKVGKVEEGSPIRWKLDEDRASLPVPQIVKDLVDYANESTLSPTLRQAEAQVRKVTGADPTDLWSISSHLLSWWEGNYFGGVTREGTDQKDYSNRYDDKWPWVQAFQLVVCNTPGLAELVEWRDGRFWFRSGVSSDVRRGTKNYVREHMEHIVVS